MQTAKLTQTVLPGGGTIYTRPGRVRSVDDEPTSSRAASSAPVAEASAPATVADRAPREARPGIKPTGEVREVESPNGRGAEPGRPRQKDRRPRPQVRRE